MGEWYWIGVAVGLGAAMGVAEAGAFGTRRRAVLVALIAGGLLGAAVGFVVDDWDEAIGGALGGLAGAFGAVEVVTGALRRGGTRAGIGLLMLIPALVVAGLAWVPGVGYAEAVLLPLLGLRLKRGGPGRYAGLRILARD